MMLLQLEIIVWIVSVIIMVIVPFVWLGHFVMRRYQRNQITQDTIEDGNESDGVEMVGDDQVDIEDEVILIDPVIAAMHQEEIDQTETIEDDIMIESEDNAILNDALIIIEDLSEDINPNKSEKLTQSSTSHLESDIMILQDDPIQIADITVINTNTGESVEVIAIDVDGDGEVDETVVIHTSPADLAEAKRHRSIEMYSYELRSLKDKNQPSSYEKKLIEARSLHQDHHEFGVMLAEHYYENSEYRKALGLYRGMVDADSTDDKSLWMIANCYIKLSEWDNAHVILERLTTDKPDNPRYWMSLTEVYYHANDTVKAIDCMRTTVKLRPKNIDYLSTLAQLYYESEHFDLYVPVLYRMLELDPLNHEIKSEIAKYA